jgi:hypothetical protein
MATTPTINPSPAAGNSPSGPFTPTAHTHPFTAITGLRFGTNGRVEPVYDAANVFANGEIIALYNASSTPGAFAAPAVPKVTVQTAMILTDGPPDVAESNQQPQKFLAEGRITQREFNTVTTPTPPDGPPAKLPKNQSTSVNSPPATGTQFPLSYVLGDTGFTLDNIIGKGVIFSRSRVVAQKGLTEAQIVTNITDWTKNIWIPFKAKYPTAFITNTFREGEKQGQHGTGQAGDIQIRGFPNVDYDQIGLWCVENLPYGQLLVEFTPGKNAWIHLSYENGTGITTKPVNKVATMNGATFEFVPGIHKSMLVKARMQRSV